MTRKDLRVVAIVPAYNEAGSIRDVVREIAAVAPPVDAVVIDDGSSDDTVRIAKEAGATVLELPFNLGIGGAVQTGFRFAVEQEYDVAIQVDGDGQHVPAEIPKLLSVLDQTDADVVIGSRFLSAIGYTTSRVRRVGVGVFRLTNSVLLRQRITDSTSGFRAYNRKTIRFLAENYPHDYPEPESVVMLVCNGFHLAETPVIMRERLHGQSSISAVRAVYYMIKVLLAIYMRLFKARLVT